MQQKKIPMRGVLLTVLTITVLFIVSTLFSMLGSHGRPREEVWNAFDRAEPGTAAKIRASASAEPGMNVTFKLKGFYSEEVVLNGQKWQRITFPDQGNIDRVGAPNVPIKRRLFAIPNNASVEVEVTDVKYKEFSNIRLEPFQRPLLETERPEAREFAIDKGLYNADEFFPGEWASVSDAGKIHGVNLGRLVIHPVRYNPVQKTLLAAGKITCNVKFSGNRTGGVETYPSNLDNILKSLLLNYDFMDYREVDHKSKADSTRAGIDYLMLCDPALINAAGVQDLVNYYSALGFTVELKDVSTIYGSTSADWIKYYIQKFVYNSQSPAELDYVLLIGDLDAIPWKHNAYQLPYYPYYIYDSDIWYGWLDGNDKIADVGVGRFPAANQKVLNQMIQKTLDFQNNVYSCDWQSKSILIAHKGECPGFDENYTECKETIYNHDYVLDPPTFDRKYGVEGATNAQVTAAINEGRLVVNYRGHGREDAWTGWNTSNEYYDTDDAFGLTNGHKTPIVFSIACSTSNLGHTGNCLAEAFVCQDQGAVAFLGSNGPCYIDVNHDFDRALYFGTWDLGNETIGDLLNYANAEVEGIHGSRAYPNMTAYLWLGDPALRTVPVGVIFTLTIIIEGEGTVTLDPPGGTYLAGTVVTLTALPDSGWTFLYWTGDLTGPQSPDTIIMDSCKTVTVRFTEIGTTKTVGNTDVFGSTSTSAYRRAMPFTMPEDGTINSVTMYHTGGSGNMILAVYDGEGTPQNRLAVTAATAVSGSTGWQTINLTSPAYVAGGSTIWLAWVYESNPGIRYQTGSPGRYQSGDTWSGGMPDPFGSGSQANYLYSIYATYTINQ